MKYESISKHNMYIETVEVAGIYPAIQGMRNPMDSWDKSDSSKDKIGLNDLKLCTSLNIAGPEHRKFKRMIQVWINARMPRYWWSEMDTYHFNTKNSSSTMHKLLARKTPLTEKDFVVNEEDNDAIRNVIEKLNDIRDQYLNTTDINLKISLKRRAKMLLPESFLQFRTMNTNYEEISNIVHQRHNHQLKEEWVDIFCTWATTLPYAKELIFNGLEDVYDVLVPKKLIK